MKQNGKQELRPKLRFPEFRDGPGWKVGKLSDVADFVTERVPLTRLRLVDYISTENILPDFRGVTRASHLPSSGSAIRFQVNDVLVSNIRPYLKKVWQATQGGGASNDVIVIRAKQGLVAEYFPYVLKSDAFIDHVMKGAKGVKMPRGDVSLMKDYGVPYPLATEQRKLADCLSSLDEVIAVQARKVEALKDHKSGLMQQIFPWEGEKKPRFRFPEFCNSPEWEEKIGSDVFSNRIKAGRGGLPIYSVTMNDGMIARSSLDRTFDDIADPNGNKTAQRDDLVYNTMRMWQGALGVAPEDCMVSPAYVVLAPHEDVSSEFFAYAFKFPLYLKRLASHSRGLTKDRLRLYYKDFALVPLLCPSFAEQQAIANLLASLDAMIAAQTEKLRLLRVHKLGLIQHLFPTSAEETEA